MKYKETDEVTLKDDYDDGNKIFIPKGTKGEVQEVLDIEKEYIVDFGSHIVQLQERELK